MIWYDMMIWHYMILYIYIIIYTIYIYISYICEAFIWCQQILVLAHPGPSHSISGTMPRMHQMAWKVDELASLCDKKPPVHLHTPSRRSDVVWFTSDWTASCSDWQLAWKHFQNCKPSHATQQVFRSCIKDKHKWVTASVEHVKDCKFQQNHLGQPGQPGLRWFSKQETAPAGPAGQQKRPSR